MPIVVVVDDRRINLKILSKLAGSLAADIIVQAFSDPVEALDWTAPPSSGASVPNPTAPMCRSSS